MAVYEEYGWNSVLDNDVPEHVLEVLRFLLGTGSKPERLPDHPFFQNERVSAGILGRSTNVEHGPDYSALEIKSGRWHLRFRMNVSTESGIWKLFHWLSAYVTDGNPCEPVGWQWSEDSDQPCFYRSYDYSLQAEHGDPDQIEEIEER